MSQSIDTYTADIQQSLNAIANDEDMLARVAKYLRRLLKSRQPDPTMMTKEEFYAMLERGEEEYRQGKTHSMLPNETLDEFLKRVVGQ